MKKKETRSKSKACLRHSAPIDSIVTWLFIGITSILVPAPLLVMHWVVRIVLSLVGIVGICIIFSLKRILKKRNHHLLQGDEYTTSIIKDTDSFFNRTVVSFISCFLLIYFFVLHSVLGKNFWDYASAIVITCSIFGIISLGGFGSVFMALYRIKKGNVVEVETGEDHGGDDFDNNVDYFKDATQGEVDKMYE